MTLHSKLSKLDGLERNPASPLIGRIGTLETRLARNHDEVMEAQALRHDVFYNELGAIADEDTNQLGRDEDPFDLFCDHILVIDQQFKKPKIVGTYRLLQKSVADQIGGFYSHSEFDLSPLLTLNPTANFLELGRSCILSQYRDKRTLELLWHGAWSYALSNKIDIMFGCASFEGTDPITHNKTLGWLGRNVLLSPDEDCLAMNGDFVDLSKIEEQDHNLRQAMSGMPPLLKGYLRLGAKTGSHAVIDHQFQTTDVLVVLKVDEINPRYIAHYGADASRFAV